MPAAIRAADDKQPDDETVAASRPGERSRAETIQGPYEPKKKSESKKSQRAASVSYSRLTSPRSQDGKKRKKKATKRSRAKASQKPHKTSRETRNAAVNKQARRCSHACGGTNHSTNKKKREGDSGVRLKRGIRRTHAWKKKKKKRGRLAQPGSHDVSFFSQSITSFGTIKRAQTRG